MKLSVLKSVVGEAIAARGVQTLELRTRKKLSYCYAGKPPNLKTINYKSKIYDIFKNKNATLF